jgi:hypothetical protein
VVPIAGPIISAATTTFQRINTQRARAPHVLHFATVHHLACVLHVLSGRKHCGAGAAAVYLKPPFKIKVLCGRGCRRMLCPKQRMNHRAVGSSREWAVAVQAGGATSAPVTTS